MPRLIRLNPHQPPLIMLDPHDPLRSVISPQAVPIEHSRVLQIRLGDVDRGARHLLETQHAVPRHVLDRHEGAVGQDDHVEVAVADQDAVRGLDDLRQHELDRVRGVVAFLFRAGVSADEDAAGAFGPVDVFWCMNGGFDVRAVEIGCCAWVGVHELGGEGEDVPEERALLDLILLAYSSRSARINLQSRKCRSKDLRRGGPD